MKENRFEFICGNKWGKYRMKKNRNFNYKALIAFTLKPKFKYFILAILIFFISIFHVFIANQIKAGMDIALGKTQGSILNEVLILIFIVMIYSLCIRIRMPFAEKLAVEGGKSLLALIYEKIYKIPQYDWDSIEKGYVFTLIESDIRIIREHLPKHLLPLVIEILGIAFGYITVFFISPRFFIIALVGSIPMILMIKYYSKKIEDNAKKLQENTGKLNDFFDEEFNNIDIIRIFKSENYSDSLFEAHFEKRKLSAVVNKDLSGRLESFSLFLAHLTNAVIIIIGIVQIKNGISTFGDLMAALTILSNVVLWPLTRLPSSFANIFQQKASFGRCAEFLNLNEEKETTKTKLQGVKSLSVKNLNYSYSNTQVLYNISINCKIGEIILIKGQSGSGKTTLLKLLLGLYKPESGEIYIETPAGKYKVDFDSVAYVPQDNFIIDGASLSENIIMGKETGNLELAVQLAGVNEFSDGLKNKLSTPVDASHGFSKGQLQRIAISRAIYRDAPFMILDEPFSALDAKNQSHIKNNLKKMAKDKGIIIISHRENGIDFADRVYTIENGRLI